jgi:hypothetical protein
LCSGIYPIHFVVAVVVGGGGGYCFMPTNTVAYISIGGEIVAIYPIHFVVGVGVGYCFMATNTVA